MNLQYEIKNFLDADGHLTMFPAKKKNQIITLFYLASKIPAVQTYTEKEINTLLEKWHTYNDSCTLRRELYNYHFIGRTSDGTAYYKESSQPLPSDFGIDTSFEPIDIFNGLKYHLPDYQLIRLTKKHKEEIFDLYSSNPYYFSLTQEHPITSEESIADLEAIPENFPMKQKFYFGIYQNRQMIAVMEYLVGYDYEHTNDIKTIWIGLFMIHGNYKRQGLGTELMHTFLQVVKENEIHKIQLACIESNIEGYAFWSQLGFKKITQTNTVLSNKETCPVILFEYD
ncbi:GNAT family N-acetyltransferase [Anaerosporobacter sp.]|uniref:GNAT family N-acetyltransferase n=1 Tax=Anaerosporobacter sp. TaxID=1872529 RepID=UPI00286FA0EA|nr:GNAT family N-acetyltransferase [Anaerosporobacter sp.]